VTDVTGAGDTVIAAFGVALAAGASFYEAARLANYAGGLVVMKRGTATVSAMELSDAVTRDHGMALEQGWTEQPQ
jgi:bifunctional ADP-heptose synthase (sugar kinase/adenylyltransferase)